MTKSQKSVFETSEEFVAKLLVHSEDRNLTLAKDQIKDQILRALASQALAEMGAPEEIASKSFALIDENHTVLQTARSVLKKMLVESIIEQVLTEFADKDRTLIELATETNPTDERILEIRDAFKTYLVGRLVESAVVEIESEVSQIPVVQSDLPDPNDAPDEPSQAQVEKEINPNPSQTVSVDETPLSYTESDVQIVQSPPPPPVSLDGSVSTASSINGSFPSAEVAILESEKEEEVESTEIGLWGNYVYGILRTNLPNPGENIFYEGVDQVHLPRIIKTGSVYVVINPLSSPEFEPSALERNLKDGAWKRKYKAIHIQVLNDLLKAGITCLPMPFGSIFESVSQLEEALEEQHDYLVDAIQRLEGKREWGVRIYCDTQQLLEVVEGSGDRIDKFIDQLPDVIANAIHNEAKATPEEELELITESCRKFSHNALLAVSNEGLLHPVTENTLPDGLWFVMHGAYLVSTEREEPFREALERLALKHSHIGLSFDVTGPRPPVSFTA